MLAIVITSFIIHYIYAFPFLFNNQGSFNVSSFLPFITSPQNASDSQIEQVKQCFVPKAGRLPIKAPDCDLAAYDMNKDFDKSADYATFSRQPSAEYRLPRIYRSGSCLIYLDMVSDMDEDTIYTAEITAETMSLVSQCVGGPDRKPEDPHLGGVADIGIRQLLHVVVFGRDDSIAPSVS